MAISVPVNIRTGRVNFLSIASFSNPKSVPARVKFVKLINHFNKVSNIKFEMTRASIARKVSYAYSISQKGGYHAAR